MRRAEEGSQVVSVRFPLPLYRATKAYAALSAQSVNAVVVEAVARFIEDLAGDEAVDALVDRRHAEPRRAAPDG